MDEIGELLQIPKIEGIQYHLLKDRHRYITNIIESAKIFNTFEMHKQSNKTIKTSYIYIKTITIIHQPSSLNILNTF